MKRQQELVRLYWHPKEKAWHVDPVNNTRVPVVIESESVVNPGWVYVREVAPGFPKTPLLMVQFSTLENRV